MCHKFVENELNIRPTPVNILPNVATALGEYDFKAGPVISPIKNIFFFYSWLNLVLIVLIYLKNSVQHYLNS